MNSGISHSCYLSSLVGFQKDMLDDPVEESLDAAVDTRRSNVAVAHETVADS